MSFLLPTPHGFYFRITVPADLREIVGKREVKKSLRTYDPKRAKVLAGILAAQYHYQFQSLRMDSMGKKLPYLPITRFEVKGFKINSDGSVEVGSVKLDPSKPAEEKELLDAWVSAASNLADSGNSKAKLAKKTSLPLADLIEKYCTEKVECGAWRPKSEDENRASYDLLLKILGNVDVSLLTHQNAIGFLQTVKRIPPYISTRPEYRGKSINQILALKPTDNLSEQSINKHCHRASSLFAWAVKRGFISQNYFEGLGVKRSVQAHLQRHQFSAADLNLIFSSAIFTARRLKHSYYYWVPLIGLYTGLRLEEICQLYLEDIRKEAEVWVFDINDRRDKKLKTLSSRRLVPIHSRLIDLGLLTYIERLGIDGRIRLFPELNKMRDGYSQMVSKWFGRYRKRIGIGNNGRKLDFHSFRHTVANHLKQSKVPEGVVGTILGHAKEGITFARYGKPYEVDYLKEIIELLNFPETNNVKPF